MSIYGMIRQKMRDKREERRDLKAVYDKALKEEKIKYAEERAKIKIDTVRQKAKESARSGGLLKQAAKKYKQYRKEKGLDKPGSNTPRLGSDTKKVWTGTGFETVSSSKKKPKQIVLKL